jgi:hypothetical protein
MRVKAVVVRKIDERRLGCAAVAVPATPIKFDPPKTTQPTLTIELKRSTAVKSSASVHNPTRIPLSAERNFVTTVCACVDLAVLATDLLLSLAR